MPIKTFPRRFFNTRPASQRSGRVVPIADVPPQIATCDDTLRRFAGQLLRQPTVRSVVVHRERGEVVVHAISDVVAVEPTGQPVEILAWNDPALPLIYCIRAPQPVTGWRRGMFLLGGACFTLLAVLGVILPGLPTTPFVLLASYCLLRSSPRWHERFLCNRLFGGVLRDWYLHRGLRPHVRYKALTVLVLVVAASLYWGGLPWWANVLIVATAACGAAYVWRLPDVLE